MHELDQLYELLSIDSQLLDPCNSFLEIVTSSEIIDEQR